MSNKKPMLVNIIDREYLQQLQEGIANAANLSTLILDHLGAPITNMTNARGICKLMEDTHQYRGLCHTTRQKLYSMAIETRKPAILTCPYSGTTVASVPIFLEDTFLGAWIIGQVRFRGDQVESFVSAAQNMGVGSDGMRRLLEEIPEYSHSEFEMIVNFMSIVTEEIVKLTSSNIEIMEKNEQLINLSERLRRSMEALHAFSDTAGVGLYVCDFDTGELIMANSFYSGFFDKTNKDMAGLICYKNLGYASRCPSCPNEKLIDEKGNPLPPDTREVYLKQHDLWLQCISRAIRWPDGRLVQMNTCIDITERRKMEQELNRMAFFDQILDIPNRERMELDMKQDGPYEYLVVVALEDLRRINNLFGRDCGDALLRAIRDYMLEMGIPGGSTLYRGKLSDFCILFKGTEGNMDLPQKIAEEINERCKKAWEITVDEQCQNIFTSVNVCVLPADLSHENSFEGLCVAVEYILDMARKTDGVIFYDDDMREKFHESLRLESSLKNAVRENMRGFYVAYQPIIDVGAAVWKGVEALCRWDSPDLGSVPPGVFIPVAEANGLIGAVGLWVLEQAVTQIKAWGLDQVEGFLLEVNLSPIQLTIPNLDQTITDVLQKHDYPPEKLGLEITESSELNLSKLAMAAIERLSKLGVVIVLDDFGAGYSSFDLLHKLPVKLLKTDRAFISGMESDGYLRHLFSVMLELAHSSDKILVAEGVEGDSQAQLLLEQGADLFQGYYFSYPLTSKQMGEKLDNFHKPIEDLVSMGYAQWDLLKPDKGLDDECQDYTLNPAADKLLNRCVREFFTNSDSNDAIDVALSQIGTALGVCRAHVVLKEIDGTYSVTHEWCGQDTQPLKDTRQHLPAEQIFLQGYNRVARDGLLVISDIRTLPKNACREASLQGIKAFIHLPIWEGNELCGYMELYHCRDTHSWTREEVQTLHNLTGLIAITLAKKRLQDEITIQGQLRESILNNIDTAIYVSDLETNKILFANKEMQRLFGDSPLTDQICWEALQNHKERCEFCPIPYLLKNPGKNYQWEFYNEHLGKHFRVHDSIIPWVRGKLAHLEYAVDITGLKDDQAEQPR